MASLGMLAFAFFSGRTYDLKVTPSFQELRRLGCVPLGAGALKACGVSGMPMRWGAQRDPSKVAGSKHSDACKTDLGRRTRIRPPSFRTFITSHISPVGTVAQARPHSTPLLPRGCSWSPRRIQLNSACFL